LVIFSVQFYFFVCREAIGPIIGGFVYTNSNFQILSVVTSAFSLSMAVIAALTMLINWHGVARWVQQKLPVTSPVLFPDSSSIVSKRASESSQLFCHTDKDQEGAEICQSLQAGAFDGCKKEKYYGSTQVR
jgi:hypothetical protein